MEATPPAARHDDPQLPSAKAESRPASPPHPLDGKWNLNIDGETYGPYDGHQLKEFALEGRLSSDTQVRRVGGFDWLPAIRDKALTSLFATDQAGPPALTATRTETVPPKVSARDGGTVVQVTNNIQQPNIGALLEPGKNKSAGVALLLTLLLVGAGQIYNGQVGKGILFFIFTVGLWFIMLGWVIHIWAMIDAYSVAKDLNGKYQRRLAAGYA